MKFAKFPYFPLAFFCALAALAAPERIVFDTDMGNGADDALAMLRRFKNEGKAEIAAVIVNKSAPDASEIMWGQMLAKGYKLSAARREILERNVMKVGPRDPYGIYMAFSAYWRARLDEARGK